MKTEEELRETKNEIAGQLLKLHDFVDELVDKYSEEEVVQLAEELELNRGYGFRVYAYDLIAARLRSLIIKRGWFAAMKDYLDKNPNDYYCITCSGSCKSEEDHNKIVGEKYSMTPDEIEVNEMTIDQLKTEVLKWRGKSKEDSRS